MTPANPDALADALNCITPEMLAAAWGAWHFRHGGKLGPGPAFAEAIAAAMAVAPLLADLQRVTAERDEYAEALMKVAEIGGWQASAGLAAEVQSRITAAEARAAQLQAENKELQTQLDALVQEVIGG